MSAPTVIIGTGLAGYTLAKEIRKHDAEQPLVLISQDDGALYSKPLLSNALSKQQDASSLVQASAEQQAATLKAEILTHCQVLAIEPDQHRLRHSQGELYYSRLVLATGAAVRPVPPPLSELQHVYSVNDLTDYARYRAALPEQGHIAILGAGLIGCEFANDLANAGYQVSMIAPRDQVMPGLIPPPVATAVEQALADLGVTSYLNTSVIEACNVSAGIELRLAGDQRLQADRLVSAIGLLPNTDLAQAAGLVCQRGVLVDAELRSSSPDIYALGDCASIQGHNLLYVQPLMAAARALARTLTGQPTSLTLPAMPVTVKTPCCPIAALPPTPGAEGHWQLEQSSAGLKALYYGADEQLLGFALTGDLCKEKSKLARTLPPLLTNP